VLERERLLVEHRRLAIARVLPRGDVRELLVVAHRLAVSRLVLLAEVPAAALLAVQRVDAHQLGELEEARDPPPLLERLVQLGARARYRDVAPELLAQLRDGRERLVEALRVSRHAA